jgi:hypothetical protein
MKVTQIEYAALYNTGNYEHEKVGLTVQLEEGEAPEEVVVALRKKTAEMVGPKAMEQVMLKHELNQAVKKMQEKAELAQAEYETAKAFMEAQGLKMDMPSFPFLKTLLPAKDSQPKLPEPDVETVRMPDIFPNGHAAPFEDANNGDFDEDEEE